MFSQVDKQVSVSLDLPVVHAGSLRSRCVHGARRATPAATLKVPGAPGSLTRRLLVLVAAAEDEAAIHHRPTVSSEAVTHKANRINKA